MKRKTKSSFLQFFFTILGGGDRLKCLYDLEISKERESESHVVAHNHNPCTQAETGKL